MCIFYHIVSLKLPTIGTAGWIQTNDLRIRNPMLYSLSYSRIKSETGVEPVSLTVVYRGLEPLCVGSYPTYHHALIFGTPGRT